MKKYKLWTKNTITAGIAAWIFIVISGLANVIIDPQWGIIKNFRKADREARTFYIQYRSHQLENQRRELSNELKRTYAGDDRILEVNELRELLDKVQYKELISGATEICVYDPNIFRLREKENRINYEEWADKHHDYLFHSYEYQEKEPIRKVYRDEDIVYIPVNKAKEALEKLI